MPSRRTTRRSPLTSIAGSLILLPAVSAAYGGCLSVCIANSGCSTASAKCVCSSSASSNFLGSVVECIAELCLLGTTASVDDAISAIDKQFIEVVDSECASKDLDIPASKISSALSAASSIVSSVLGGGGTAATTTKSLTTTPTAAATTQKTQTTQTTAAKTSSSSSSSSSSASTTISPSTSSAAASAPSSTAETSSSATLPLAASSPDTTEVAQTDGTTTQSTTTAKQKSTSTKADPAVDTTDSSPFTNTNSAASSLGHGAAWWVPAVAVLPMFLRMAL